MGVNAKLADITAVNSLVGGELIYVEQGGNSRQATLSAAGARFLDSGDMISPLKMHVLSGLSGAGYTPYLDMNVQESFTSGSSFHITSAVVGEKLAGGTGPRTAHYVTQGSAVDEAGKFIVGIQGTAIARSGSSGNFFGVNGYSEILSGAASSAESVGGEMNTSVRNTSVLRKVGMHIADVDGSTAAGTVFDAGLMILRSSDSVGYLHGIHFSRNSGAGFPIKSTGTILETDTGAVTDGIDLSNLTISGNAFASNQFHVDGLGKLQALGVFARAGSAGTVRSNVFNVDWDGTNPLLYIDTTSLGQIVYSTATSASATAGAATLPANPVGFLTVKRDGTNIKIPYYAE
ncbi:hypothetical protein LJR235_002381 [Pararhizobium sp. LjRoot235]|uniref:hypothetical protein n=1 Tax=Pararhizobium sp. LjRoot235 TaxID=3342291 RepID=UPI003ED04728